MKRLSVANLSILVLMATLSVSSAIAGSVPLKELPAPVQKSIQIEVGGDEIVTIAETIAGGGNGYRITWTVEGVVIHTTFSAAGSVVDRVAEVSGSVAASVDEEDEAEEEAGETEEEFERGITIELVPEPAKSAILKEAAGSELAEVEIIVAAGRLLYDADWVVDGKEIAITVTPDGSIVDREEEPVKQEED